MIKILLVESDLKWAFLIEKSLINFKVTCVDSAQEAMDKLDENKFDFLVINLDLPTHNGIELLNERASHTDINNTACIVYSTSELMKDISKTAWSAYRVAEFIPQIQITQQLLPTVNKFIKNAPVYN